MQLVVTHSRLSTGGSHGSVVSLIVTRWLSADHQFWFFSCRMLIFLLLICLQPRDTKDFTFVLNPYGWLLVTKPGRTPATMPTWAVCIMQLNVDGLSAAKCIVIQSLAESHQIDPGCTLQMKTLFPGWPIMVHDTHTRIRTIGQPGNSVFICRV